MNKVEIRIGLRNGYSEEWLDEVINDIKYTLRNNPNTKKWTGVTAMPFAVEDDTNNQYMYNIEIK